MILHECCFFADGHLSKPEASHTGNLHYNIWCFA